MTDQEIADQVREILGRYRVHNHYRASSAGEDAESRRIRRTLYAVWCGSKELGTLQQVTDPASHAEAQECRIGLITADIIELIEKERKA